MPDKENANDAPTTISVGGKDYSTDDITKLVEQSTHTEDNAKLIQAGQVWREAAAAAETGDLSKINELKGILESSYPGKKKVEPVELGELKLDDSATDNEKSLAAYLSKQTEAFSQHQTSQQEYKDELNDVLRQIVGNSKTDSAASTAVKQVQAELGIQVTSEDIKTAMRTHGIDDPIKAIKIDKWDELQKAGAPSNRSKPNMVVDEVVEPKDFDKMTLEEKMALPDDVKQQILQKQQDAKKGRMFKDVR